jgi:hypothetical protein
MGVIKRETHLMGIKWWVQWYQSDVVPKFDVMEYVGHDLDTGLYYFRVRRSKALMSKSRSQLYTNGFKPFCLEFKTITEWRNNGAPV